MLAFRTYLSGVSMRSVYGPAQLSIQISTSKMALKLGLAQYCPVFEHSLRWLWGPLVVKVLVKVYHSLGLTIPLVAISLRLGLHEDTPALAPFLGKEPIRRGIRVYEQDEQVDICTPIQNTAARTNRWGTVHEKRRSLANWEDGSYCRDRSRCLERGFKWI